MNVGICWPSPGRDPQPIFDASVLDVLRESTKATHLRINLHHARGVAEALHHVTHIRSRGWEVLPILDFDYERPAVGAYATFCAEVVPACGFEVVELGNEPHIMHKMDPGSYAAVFTAGARAVRDTGMLAEILIACEATQPPAKRIDYFGQVRRQVPVELYDGLSIHPYRNPQPPEKTPFGTREAEWAYYASQAPGKAIHVSEDGWDLRSGVGLSEQAEYTRRELEILEQLGARSAYVFAYSDELSNHNFDFGVLDRERRPRPVAGAIARFQAERSVS